MADTVKSRNGILIDLTEERWGQIVAEDAELVELREDVLRTIANPGRILAGDADEMLAVGEIANGKWIVVVYRESDADHSIISAYLTRQYRTLARRKVLWSRLSNI